MKLSEAEQAALEWLRQDGGEMLTSKVPETNERNCVFGNVTPGLGVFRKLEKKGLVFFTVEDPFEIEPGLWFTFTNSVCLVTDPKTVTG